MSNLKEIEFKNFITLQRGFDLPSRLRVEGDYPIVASTTINGFHKEYKVLPPGVVTGRSGSLGEVQYINQKFWPLNTALWVKDFKGNLPKYVYFFLKTLDLQRFNSGAGVPTLNRNDLDSLEIKVHNYPTQQKIAGILSAYDDLIENNTRRIEILEEMARMLYREWFVKFRFPGHEAVQFVESELGLIPEGWEVKTVDEIVKRLKSKKNYKESEVEKSGAIPIFDQSRDEFLGFHNEEADFNASTDNPMIIFGDHTCKMQLIVEPFSIAPNVIPFISQKNIPITYLYFLVNSLVETIEYKRHWTEFKNKKVIVCSDRLPENFHNFTKVNFSEIDCLRKKNINLRKTRDLLLPRLISGEIDVENLAINTGIQP